MTTFQEPTQRKYHLTCKVTAKKMSFEDYQSKGRFQNENWFVFLEPVENDERNRFFAAWIPDVANEHHEVVLEIGHPIHMPGRAAVFRSSVRFPKPHLQLMTYGLTQEIIEKKLYDREMLVTILGEEEDNAADFAPKGDIPFEKKKYD